MGTYLFHWRCLNAELRYRSVMILNHHEGEAGSLADTVLQMGEILLYLEHDEQNMEKLYRMHSLLRPS